MKAEIVNLNGAYAVKIGDEIKRFAGYRSWRPESKYISAFDKRGFNFMTLLPSGIRNAHGTMYSPYGEYWQGDGVYDFSILKRQIDDFVESAPNTRLAINLMLDTRDWFLKEHPECPNSFIYISSAISYEPWIKCAERMLKDTIDYLEREYGDRVFAVILSAGGTTEWHNKALDFPRKEETLRHYRAWCGDPDAAMPTSEELSSTRAEGFRDAASEANIIRFYKYFNTVVNDAISHFTALVKRHTEGRLLVGVAAGYLLAAENALSAVSEAAELMADDCIDFIACPASYYHRKLDGVTYSQASLDSVRFNGKLFVHSIDNATAAVNANPYVQILQRSHCRHENMEQSINYARRECCFAMSKGAGFWFFDQYGGWYPDEQSQDELAKILDAYGEIYSNPVSYNSEIALILDPTYCYMTNAGSLIKKENVMDLIDKLGRVGAPFDCFSVRDVCLDSFDFSQYKLFIFANSVMPDGKLKGTVARLRDMGKSLLFLGHSGLVTEHGLDCRSASEFVGIELDIDEGEEFFTLVSEEYTASGEPKIYGGRTGGKFSPAGVSNALVRPLLFANDNGARLLGTDFKSGVGRLAMKRRGDAFDIWSLRGDIPNEILDPIVEWAGVFRYQTEGLPTYANSRMVALFDHKGGERKISFREMGKYREFFSGEVYTYGGTPITVSFTSDECKLFIPLT